MTSDTRGPRERAYDEHISPLMRSIIKLCREHNISMFSNFVLDYDEDEESHLQCTTALPLDEDERVVDGINRLYRECLRKSVTVAMTFTKLPGGRDDA